MLGAHMRINMCLMAKDKDAIGLCCVFREVSIILWRFTWMVSPHKLGRNG